MKTVSICLYNRTIVCNSANGQVANAACLNCSRFRDIENGHLDSTVDAEKR